MPAKRVASKGRKPRAAAGVVIRAIAVDAEAAPAAPVAPPAAPAKAKPATPPHAPPPQAPPPAWPLPQAAPRAIARAAPPPPASAGLGSCCVVALLLLLLCVPALSALGGGGIWLPSSGGGDHRSFVRDARCGPKAASGPSACGCIPPAYAALTDGEAAKPSHRAASRLASARRPVSGARLVGTESDLEDSLEEMRAAYPCLCFYEVTQADASSVASLHAALKKASGGQQCWVFVARNVDAWPQAVSHSLKSLLENGDISLTVDAEGGPTVRSASLLIAHGVTTLKGKVEDRVLRMLPE